MHFLFSQFKDDNTPVTRFQCKQTPYTTFFVHNAEHNKTWQCRFQNKKIQRETMWFFIPYRVLLHIPTSKQKNHIDDTIAVTP
jgi:hypothetical protein